MQKNEEQKKKLFFLKMPFLFFYFQYTFFFFLRLHSVIWRAQKNPWMRLKTLIICFYEKYWGRSFTWVFNRIGGSIICVLESPKKVFLAHHNVIGVYTLYCFNVGASSRLCPIICIIYLYFMYNICFKNSWVVPFELIFRPSNAKHDGLFTKS